jgi:uncharacterized membrane protein HdeD (DUF308 family)
MSRLIHLAPHLGIVLIVVGIGLVVFQMTRSPHTCEASQHGDGYIHKLDPTISTTYLGIILIAAGIILLVAAATAGV